MLVGISGQHSAHAVAHRSSAHPWWWGASCENVAICGGPIEFIVSPSNIL